MKRKEELSVHPLLSASLSGRRTGARHLQRVRIGPVIAVPADAVGGSFGCGPAVDWTVDAALIPLVGFERPGRAAWIGKREKMGGWVIVKRGEGADSGRQLLCPIHLTAFLNLGLIQHFCKEYR